MTAQVTAVSLAGADDRLTLQEAGRHEADRGCHYPPHRHTTWQFVYYLSGAIACPTGTETHLTVPGLVLITPPGVVHAERARTDYTNYYLDVRAPARRAWPRALLDDEQGTLRSLFALVVREWRGQDPHREDAVAHALALLDIVLRRAGEQRPLTRAEELVRGAEAIMEDGHGHSLRIEDVAQRLHVSPSSLRAHFLRLRGRTPIQHLQQIRLRHALATIRTSDLPLERVAEFCGYNSISHLSRSVKMLTGRTPGSFRAGPRRRPSELDEAGG